MSIVFKTGRLSIGTSERALAPLGGSPGLQMATWRSKNERQSTTDKRARTAEHVSVGTHGLNKTRLPPSCRPYGQAHRLTTRQLPSQSTSSPNKEQARQRMAQVNVKVGQAMTTAMAVLKARWRATMLRSVSTPRHRRLSRRQPAKEYETRICTIRILSGSSGEARCVCHQVQLIMARHVARVAKQQNCTAKAARSGVKSRPEACCGRGRGVKGSSEPRILHRGLCGV